ncbi:hypothetical protein HN615_07195 [Candidatus Woesearchaeota archaeon]|jgi:hypothetical protein|nr:hypothetical protein [Candidatus Woesearchaeota archaeon]
MIETVWIAFACGLVIGSCLGIFTLALVSAGKTEDLMRENERLTQTRQLLKEEIFRMEKNYKPRKPQPRYKRRNYNQKKNNQKKQ